MEPRRMSAAAKRWRPSWGSVSRVIEHRPWSGRSDQSLERLTAALSGRAGGDRWSAQSYEVLREVSNTDFLQAVTLLATTDLRAKYLKANSDDERAPRVGCRRVDILNLPLESYQRWAPDAVSGFMKAAKLIHQMCIFDTRFLPYGSQLIPLAAILSALGTDGTT